MREIFADLTAGIIDLTAAKCLRENADICFMGTTKVGPFDIDAETARAWLVLPVNANGRSNADVVRPWRNALHITRRIEDAWIVDFGTEMGERDAAFYAAPFAHVIRKVKPERDRQNREAYRRLWWRHAEARSGMRRAIRGFARYIATPRVSKHRLFVWLDASVVPDSRLFIFASDSDTMFGILHSRFHEAWSLATCSWHGVGNDPTYNGESCFETFPFLDGVSPNVLPTAYATNPHAQSIAAAARALVEARDRWLNPPDLVDRVPEVVPGFPDRLVPRNPAAVSKLKKRTLTALYNTRGTPEGAWLDNLHRALDEAVAAAYGWPADIPTEDVLARLLALNHARAAAQTTTAARPTRRVQENGVAGVPEGGIGESKTRIYTNYS